MPFKNLSVFLALIVLPLTTLGNKNGTYIRDTTLMATVNNLMQTNAYLKAFKDVQMFPSPNQRNSFEMQMHLTFASFLGNNPYYNALIDRSERGFNSNEQIIETIKSKGLAEEDIFPTLLQEAKSTNVVMVNENHYYPQHRSFVLDLLPRLKEIGYTYLALEGLDKGQDSILNLPGAYPTLKTGFYTREQNFSNLIREAKTLGFKFIGYENFDANKDRETAQAENLYNKSIKNDSQAKVIVLAGIDHILEKPTASGKSWMAHVFQKQYGIDPLTISQTHLNLYRKHTLHKYQLLSAKEIPNIASVDYLLLNKAPTHASLWEEAYPYENKRMQEVQLSAFYRKELENKDDFSNLIPYYTALVKGGERVFIPYHFKEALVVVVFDQSGNVIEKNSYNFYRE